METASNQLSINSSEKDIKNHASLGKKIYEEKYKTEFEEKYKGLVAAIHIQSSDAFIGETMKKAFFEGQKKYPNDTFFFVRIGFEAFKRRR